MVEMRFRQLDQITLLEPGKRIEALKLLTGEEDYLRDHFPRFAVMPGVLMLEALYQASALLVRASEQHQPGLVMLKATRNVKFADFVEPGQTLEISAEVLKKQDKVYTLKAVGHKGDVTTVSGRLVVECVETNADSVVDRHAARFMRHLSDQLQQAGMASK